MISPAQRLANELNEAEVSLLRQTDDFARDQLTALAPVWEAERRMGDSALREAASMGLTKIQVPKNYGGLAMSFRCKAAVAETLAQADFGFSMSLINTHNVAAKLASDAPASIADAYVPDLLAAKRVGCTALTELGAGSDFSAIKTLATKNDDGWTLNGEKAWITNAAVADVIVMYVQTDPNAGGTGIAGLIIDGQRTGFSRESSYAMAGQHSIGAGGFRLSEYQAADHEMFLAPGEAFKSALNSINGARIYVAAMCCGMLASAIESARQFGLHRKTFGKNLHGHQGWRWTLAEASAELLAAQQLVDSISTRLDRGENVRFEAAKTKVFATRAAERHLGAMMQAMGAEGLRADHPLSRHQIGVRMAGFVDGSTEILLDGIAASLSSTKN